MLRLPVLSISHSKRPEHDAVHGPRMTGACPDAPLGGGLHARRPIRNRAAAGAAKGDPPIQSCALGSSRSTAYDP